MIQKTSLVEQIVAWFLMAGVWIVWTAGCGAMLVLQDQKMNARQAVAVAACNDAASRVTGAGEPQRSPGPELEHGDRGLRSEYLASGPARAAYAQCLEDRDRWVAHSAGLGERIPPS
jgi:hypothetical protein